ncbi:MAG: DUF805 domain-containing protein [Alphaproteobacteria bacterium]|nr:DUF805 domain-containing protein [Alphaproteobacteria bacterium]
MTFEQSIKTCLRKYAVFSGRAPRSEYWWWILFVILADLFIVIFDNAIFDIRPEDEWWGGPFSILFSLLTLLPTIAVAARRLHDINRTGWWVLWWPLIMVAVVLAGAPFTLYVNEDIAYIIWLHVAVGVGICIIWEIVWFASRGTQGDNRFGPDPLALPTQEAERQEP